MEDYPTTKQEWWESVNKNWENIKSFVLEYCPILEHFPEDGYETSNSPLQAPQNACNTVIKNIQKSKTRVSKEDLEKIIENYKGRQDKRLVDILSDTWYGLPEKAYVRVKPGFHVFCDLCSESYLLGE